MELDLELDITLGIFFFQLTEFIREDKHAQREKLH